jgi:hypothetical protein
MARYALRFEVNIYKSLLRWVLRRPSVPAGHEPVGYAQLVTPVLGLWIFASAIEIPLVHVLVPWDGARIVLLVAGVWGLLWMLGLLAGFRTYPHLIGDEALRIRSGPLHDIVVPLDAIAGVTAKQRSLPSSLWTLQVEQTEGGAHLNVVVSGEVNVHLTLREPQTVRTRKGEADVDAISFWADEPRKVAGRLRGLAEDPRPVGGPRRQSLSAGRTGPAP